MRLYVLAPCHIPGCLSAFPQFPWQKSSSSRLLLKREKVTSSFIMTETVQTDEFQCGELATRETYLNFPYKDVRFHYRLSQQNPRIQVSSSFF